MSVKTRKQVRDAALAKAKRLFSKEQGRERDINDPADENLYNIYLLESLRSQLEKFKGTPTEDVVLSLIQEIPTGPEPRTLVPGPSDLERPVENKAPTPSMPPLSESAAPPIYEPRTLPISSEPSTIKVAPLSASSEPRSPYPCLDEGSPDFSANTPPPQQEEISAAPMPMPSTSAALCYPEDDDDWSNVINAQTLFEERRLVSIEDRATKALDGYDDLSEALDTYTTETNRDIKLLDEALKTYAQEFAKFRSHFYLAMAERNTLVSVPDNSNTVALDTKKERVGDLSSPTLSLPARAPTPLHRLYCYLSKYFDFNKVMDPATLSPIALMLFFTSIVLSYAVYRYYTLKLYIAIPLAVAIELGIIYLPIHRATIKKVTFSYYFWFIFALVCSISSLVGPPIASYIEDYKQANIKYTHSQLQDISQNHAAIRPLDEQINLLQSALTSNAQLLTNHQNIIDRYNSRNLVTTASEYQAKHFIPLQNKIHEIESSITKLRLEKIAKIEDLQKAAPVPFDFVKLITSLMDSAPLLCVFGLNIFLAHHIPYRIRREP